MSQFRRDGLGQRLRMYSVALGFVLGQIGPLATTPPRQPPAIVRTRANDLDPRGFDSRESVQGRFVLTTPHVLVVDQGGGGPPNPSPIERAWIRNN